MSNPLPQMENVPPGCNHTRLQQLLTESLSERDEAELSAHVASCSACQRQLEDFAAGSDWWTEASHRLSSAVAASEKLSGEDLSHDDEAAHFATDFAVDFLEPNDDPATLGRLGEYEIVEVIGRGGMGIVLKGFQKELHRHIAVKVLSPHLATSGAARRRFAREAQATAAVVHPHVMAIHSVNATAKLPYLVMPFVPCESLQQRLDKHGPLDVIDILRIGMQAACGLAAAHAQGLVHRDVKPANILLETNVDRVLLTDFGLARAVDDATLTRTGIIAGTPQFMSPEQANGDPIDHRSDLFSLGSVLYTMCTGRPPFRAETTFGVLRRIRETAPRSIREINADIPIWLDRLVMKLLEKEAAERIDTAQAVTALLENCLAHVQQPTTVPLPAGSAGWTLLPADPPCASLSAPPSRLRVRSALFTATALLSIALIATWLTFGPRNGKRLRDDFHSDAVATPSIESAIPSPSDVPLNWTAAQTELDAATEEIEQLEAAMNDDLETPTPHTSQPTDPLVEDDQ